MTAAVKPYWSDDTVTLHLGDCRDVLASLPDASVDAVVTDPPYELAFMGSAWDASGIAYDPAMWREVLRVLKPGGHLLAFGGTRTYHRMASAIEDAGFEIRDSIHWVYGAGFPKSLDVSKAIDKAAGAKREVIGRTVTPFKVDAAAERGTSLQGSVNGDFSKQRTEDGYRVTEVTAPATDDARRWNGWGTALKPAHEPIVLARRPLAGTVAANVLEHGTGAINVDATRVSPSSPEHGAPVSALQSSRGSRHGNAYGAPEVSPDSRRRTSPEQPAYSNACTCPDRESGSSPRSRRTLLAAESEPSPVRRSDRPASAQADGNGCQPPQDSRGDYRPSPRSGGGRALSAAEGGQAFSPQQLDAPEYRDPHATPERSQPDLSTACPNCTAPDVQRPAKEEGRWPTNLVLTHSASCAEDGPCAPGCPVAELDQQSGHLKSGLYEPHHADNGKGAGTYGAMSGRARTAATYGDEGGASRFFPVFRYEAKAPARERPRLPDGTAHPTVKPLALIRWLVRLVTPPGGVVLDPFAGTGTTGEAAVVEGFKAVLVEQDPQNAELVKARLSKPIQPTLGDLFGEAS